MMAVLPRDVSDLYFAPVVLAVDERIEEMGRLSPDELSFQVALEGDHADWTHELRESGLLQALGNALDLHEWELAWDPRGIRLNHAHHSVVLGVPGSFTTYINGS
jgi:hypothetical protein